MSFHKYSEMLGNYWRKAMGLLSSISTSAKNMWLKVVIATIVERIPVLKTVFSWVDGHEAQIGRTIMFTSALCLGQHEVVHKFMLGSTVDLYLEHINGYIGLLIGYLVNELGLQHDDWKELKEYEDSLEGKKDDGSDDASG